MYESAYLSSLAALSARVYSTAFSKGCKLGSKFFWTFCRSWLRSLEHSAADLLMAFTFIQCLTSF